MVSVLSWLQASSQARVSKSVCNPKQGGDEVQHAEGHELELCGALWRSRIREKHHE